MNHAIDYVERRESEPRLSRQQMDDALDEERQARLKDAYDHHLRVARTAIQTTPIDLVTPAFIGAVLDTLGCKAIEANMPEVGEEIEVLACKVTP